MTIPQLKENYPPRRVLKQMINGGEWQRLGVIFQFTPLFMSIDGRNVIDWRCIPEELQTILHCKEENPEGLIVKTCFLLPKSKRSQVHPKTKTILYAKQAGVCYYCRNYTLFSEWSIDHKTPRCRGGANAKPNKVGCCKKCNGHKANLTEEEFISVQHDHHARKELIRKFSKDIAVSMSLAKQNGGRPKAIREHAKRIRMHLL